MTTPLKRCAFCCCCFFRASVMNFELELGARMTYHYWCDWRQKFFSKKHRNILLWFKSFDWLRPPLHISISWLDHWQQTSVSIAHVTPKTTLVKRNLCSLCRLRCESPLTKLHLCIALIKLSLTYTPPTLTQTTHINEAHTPEYWEQSTEMNGTVRKDQFIAIN